MPSRDSHLLRELRATPDALRSTLNAADGFRATEALLASPRVRRIIATGNGASYYVALALWLASLDGRESGREVVALPSGILRAFTRRTSSPGDVLLLVSSSGEFRDLIEAVEESVATPLAAITANPSSTLGRRAGARAVVCVLSQEAVTHTQAFCGSIVTVLSIWAGLTGDTTLGEALAGTPDVLRGAFDEASAWSAETVERIGDIRSAVAFGSDTAWPAALEAALLLKEVAAIPAEGCETREGATSAMYALGEQDLVLSLPTGPDARVDEAEAFCKARGATVVRVPGGDRLDPRLAAVSTFPFVVALSAELARRRGVDIDHPSWASAYYETARVKARS